MIVCLYSSKTGCGKWNCKSKPKPNDSKDLTEAVMELDRETENVPTEGICTCSRPLTNQNEAREGCTVGATAAVVRVLFCFHRRQLVDRMAPMKPFTLHLVPV